MNKSHVRVPTSGMSIHKYFGARKITTEPTSYTKKTNGSTINYMLGLRVGGDMFNISFHSIYF